MTAASRFRRAVCFHDSAVCTVRQALRKRGPMRPGGTKGDLVSLRRLLEAKAVIPVRCPEQAQLEAVRARPSPLHVRTCRLRALTPSCNPPVPTALRVTR